ncbi:MAG: tetratricopeptide repeat protein, partial [Pirellulales bacterium]
GGGRSPRRGAEWLRLYLRGPHDPESAADDWGKVAEAEEQLLRQAPQQTREAIVTGVWRQRVTWLRKLGRRDEAVAAMMKLASREQQSSRTLTELIQWLVAEQAYSMVDEVAKRFADRIEQDPLLLYTLADARDAQGNEALARETAERALKLNEGDQRQHWIVADALQRRGQRKWAEGEYNLVIGQGEPGAPITLISQFRLAELMHDRGDDLAAAGVLEAAVKGMESNVKQGKEDANLGRDVTAVASRLHFFHACHLDTKGDYAGHVDRLEQALAQDPLDADVLIALYRLASATPEQKERTREGIRNAVEEFRRQIQRHPEDSTPYNQLAWLVSNTEGDQKEALESSLKSLELVRKSEESRVNEAGYLDTLAHCYYAQGDFERAVQTQSKAVELDPHSGLMNRQLALFREALAKSKQDQQ